MVFKHAAWNSFDGPAVYDPDRVAAAFALLATAGSEAEAQAAYEASLSALGNNHAGTFYPAALAAIPLLRWYQDNRATRRWPRWVAAEVLQDLGQTFVAEPGYETMQLPSGTTCDVATIARLLARHPIHVDEAVATEQYPIHGVIRWLTAEEGGRRKPTPLAPWAAAAFVAPSGLERGVASFVVNHSSDDLISAASCRWLFHDRHAIFEAVPGVSLHVVQGPQTVALFDVLGVSG